MKIERLRVLVSSVFAFGSLVGLGCRAGDVPDAPQLRGRAKEEPVDSPAERAAADNGSSESPRVPDYLTAMRDLLEIGHVGLALRHADALLEAHPDDPWVLADVGYTKGVLRKGDEDGELLRRALQLAKDPSLRARVLYYQARIQQQRARLPAGRALILDALAVAPMGPAQRNLELIDGAPGDFQSSTSPLTQAACQQRLQGKSTKLEHLSCVGMELGGTSWIRVTQLFDDAASNLRVFHYWHLVSPAPASAARFRQSEEDGVFALCSGTELVTLGGNYGGEGAVLETETLKHDSEDYLIVHCRKDQYTKDDNGHPASLAASIYVQVCSLESGRCSEEFYTREALHDGTIVEAKFEVRDGTVVTTRPGEEPRPWVLP